MAKQNSNKDALVSVVAGAVAIAGAAVAIGLKDKKTRDKVRNVLTNAKDQALSYMDTLQTEPAKKRGKRNIS